MTYVDGGQMFASSVYGYWILLRRDSIDNSEETKTKGVYQYYRPVVTHALSLVCPNLNCIWSVVNGEGITVQNKRVAGDTIKKQTVIGTTKKGGLYTMQVNVTYTARAWSCRELE